MVEISLCMIVKNEEANLEKCLKNIAGYMDEIIIVDTGSTDKTKDIALRYTDKVFDFTWNNSFADARNYSISKASKDYILVIDSDEIVVSVDIDKIKKLILEHPTKIGRLHRVNEYTRNGTFYKYSERVNRLFSARYFQYEGIIHEQLVPKLEMGTETYHIPLTINHSGYEGNLELRRNKTERNINLLQLALKNTPDDPYILYQLAKSYYMEEDYQTACSYFEEALAIDLDPNLEYVQDMVESYGYTLINTAQYEKAMQLLNVYDEFAKTADFIFMIALVLMNNGAFQEAINEFSKATLKNDCKMEGVNDYLAYYNIAVIYECLGDSKNAILFYEKCKSYPLALERRAALIER